MLPNCYNISILFPSGKLFENATSKTEEKFRYLFCIVSLHWNIQVHLKYYLKETNFREINFCMD